MVDSHLSRTISHNNKPFSLRLLSLMLLSQQQTSNYTSPNPNVAGDLMRRLGMETTREKVTICESRKEASGETTLAHAWM